MSSIRPLATIMLLAVVGFFLYAKITETEPVIPAAVGDFEIDAVDAGVTEAPTWTNDANASATTVAANDPAAAPPAFTPSDASSAPPAWNGDAAAPAAAPAEVPPASVEATADPDAFVAIPEIGAAPAAPQTAAASQAIAIPDMPALPDEKAAASDAAASVATATPPAPAATTAVAPATVPAAGDRYGASPDASQLPPAFDASAGVTPTDAPASTEPATSGGRYGVAAAAGAAGAIAAEKLLSKNETTPVAPPAATTPPTDPAAAPPATTPTAEESTAPSAGGSSYAQSKRAIQAALDRGELAQALQMLSDWHDDPALSATESAEVDDLLGQLAGSVIYSTDHRLEAPCLVQEGETLEQIAARYNVPPALLGKINGVMPGQKLNAGQELKVVRGPFSARIDLSEREMTLMLDRRYAGRFALEVDPALTVEDGQWEVVDKPLTPASAATYPAPPTDGVNRSLTLQNPTAMSGQVAILRGPGGNDPVSPEPTGRVIRLGSVDLEDVYDILSVGSRVTIRR